MKNARKWFGNFNRARSAKVPLLIIALAAVFGLLLTGCELLENGYTFEFRVDLSGSLISGKVVKIEFINGSNENAPVLSTEVVNLSSGQMSSTYKVSGFTEKVGDDKRILGVRMTVRNPDGSEGTEFEWTSAKDGAKIRIWSSGIVIMRLSEGNW